MVWTSKREWWISWNEEGETDRERGVVAFLYLSLSSLCLFIPLLLLFSLVLFFFFFSFFSLSLSLMYNKYNPCRPCKLRTSTKYVEKQKEWHGLRGLSSGVLYLLRTVFPRAQLSLNDMVLEWVSLQTGRSGKWSQLVVYPRRLHRSRVSPPPPPSLSIYICFIHRGGTPNKIEAVNSCIDELWREKLGKRALWDSISLCLFAILRVGDRGRSFEVVPISYRPSPSPPLLRSLLLSIPRFLFVCLVLPPFFLSFLSPSRVHAFIFSSFTQISYFRFW